MNIPASTPRHLGISEQEAAQLRRWNQGTNFRKAHELTHCEPKEAALRIVQLERRLDPMFDIEDLAAARVALEQSKEPGVKKFLLYILTAFAIGFFVMLTAHIWHEGLPV